MKTTLRMLQPGLVLVTPLAVSFGLTGCIEGCGPETWTTTVEAVAPYQMKDVPNARVFFEGCPGHLDVELLNAATSNDADPSVAPILGIVWDSARLDEEATQALHESGDVDGCIYDLYKYCLGE